MQCLTYWHKFKIVECAISLYPLWWALHSIHACTTETSTLTYRCDFVWIMMQDMFLVFKIYVHLKQLVTATAWITYIWSLNFWAARWMNGCRHTGEHMNGNEKAVNDNIDDKTAKQRERGRGREREQTQNKEKHRRGKTLTLVFACFFFP